MISTFTRRLVVNYISLMGHYNYTVEQGSKIECTTAVIHVAIWDTK